MIDKSSQLRQHLPAGVELVLGSYCMVAQQGVLSRTAQGYGGNRRLTDVLRAYGRNTAQQSKVLNEGPKVYLNRLENENTAG